MRAAATTVARLPVRVCATTLCVRISSVWAVSPTVVGAPARWVSRSPSARLTPSAGTAPGAPRVALVSGPSSEFATTTATAPASAAIRTFCPKGHVPRRISTTAPRERSVWSAASQPEVASWSRTSSGPLTPSGAAGRARAPWRPRGCRRPPAARSQPCSCGRRPRERSPRTPPPAALRPRSRRSHRIRAPGGPVATVRVGDPLEFFEVAVRPVAGGGGDEAGGQPGVGLRGARGWHGRCTACRERRRGKGREQSAHTVHNPSVPRSRGRWWPSSIPMAPGCCAPHTASPIRRAPSRTAVPTATPATSGQANRSCCCCCAVDDAGTAEAICAGSTAPERPSTGTTTTRTQAGVDQAARNSTDCTATSGTTHPRISRVAVTGNLP